MHRVHEPLVKLMWKESLADVLMEFSPRQLVVAILTWYEDCTQEEIAKFLGVDQRTVGRDLQKMRPIVEKVMLESCLK